MSDELVGTEAVSPQFSVVIPCRNERHFIAACLDSILAQDRPSGTVEIIVVDGMSDDGTRDIVAAYAARHGAVRLIDNPRQITPAAFNIGIRHAAGCIICPIGGHSTIPPSYLSELVSYLQASGADNVGGICRTLPATESVIAHAIAVALSHPLAVGNALFRTGAPEPRWVDTVPFGCYRREVFDRIGLFDEELVRNQDDEFNHRLIRSGGRILLVPSVVIDYYARATLAQLARMMYQYGLFKPLAARKLGGATTVRQLVPPVFVAALILTLLCSPVSTVARFLFLCIATSYSALLLAAAVRAAPRHGVAVALRLIAAIPAIHLAYGGGYLRGLWTFVIRARGAPRDHSAIAVTR